MTVHWSKPAFFGLALVLLTVVGGLVVGGSLTGEQTTHDGIQFRNVSGEVGLDYEATEPATPTGAAGVYVTDFDRDGRPDVLLLGGKNSTGLFPEGPILFENTGDGFSPANELPRAAFDGQVVESALFFDHDNDGWDDLLLLVRGGTPIFLENDRGRFRVRDVGLDTKLDRPMGATTADYDGDGCLDLFVFQNGEWKSRIPDGMAMTIRDDENVTVTDDNGNPNLFYRGDCGSFTNVTEAAGVGGARWTLAASFVDLTGDGRPDIHVANDYNHDFLYVNEGDGTFDRRRLSEATNRNAMSSEVADIDGDGRLDVFVTNIYIDTSNLTGPQRNFVENRIGKRIAGNNLLMNRGEGRFVDRAEAYNVRRGGWGWAASVADFDNDGDRDLVHTTEVLDVYYEGTTATSFAIHPVFRERTGSEFRLLDPEELGFESTDGRGVARLDYDRDGRLDLVFGNYRRGERYVLYENRSPRENWFRIRVRGSPRQTAIGADVYVTVDGRTSHRRMTDRADFLSQESRVIHVGLGNHTRVDSVRVVWPDGTERRFTELDANQRVIASPNGSLERESEHSGSFPEEAVTAIRGAFDRIL